MALLLKLIILYVVVLGIYNFMDTHEMDWVSPIMVSVVLAISSCILIIKDYWLV